jgi:glucokinase
MSLSGVNIGSYLKDKFRVPIAVGNDCNLGALGEKWLGSARRADSVVAILVGTGIGGGYVQKGKLWRGARESAAEIGHIVMQIDGPVCGCGNRGCLEALASRTAIERDLREAIAAGRSSILSAPSQDDLSVIRSGTLRRALAMNDELTAEVMRHATEVLGHACLTVRHLIDPEVIVLGGGVVEACGEFMMPIVEEIVASDQLPGAREGGHVLVSALGDDAVVVGAVALARRLVGRSPFKKGFIVRPKYPKIQWNDDGEITIGEAPYHQDLFISVAGKVKKQKSSRPAELHRPEHVIGPEQLERACRGGPELLLIGTGKSDRFELSDAAQRYLTRRSIDYSILTTPKAVDAYNKSRQRRAAMLRVA